MGNKNNPKTHMFRRVTVRKQLLTEKLGEFKQSMTIELISLNQFQNK